MSPSVAVRLVLSAVVVLASVATLLVVHHPGVLGCPGSAVSPLVDCRLVVSSAGGKVLGLHLGMWALLWLAFYWVVWLVRRDLRWIAPALAFLGVAYAIGTELRVGHLCMWCTVDQAALTTIAIVTLAARERAS